MCVCVCVCGYKDIIPAVPCSEESEFEFSQMIGFWLDDCLILWNKSNSDNVLTVNDRLRSYNGCGVDQSDLLLCCVLHFLIVYII